MLSRLIIALAGFTFLQLAAPNPTTAPAISAASASADIDTWRADFERRMLLAGHNQIAVRQALDGIALEPRVETHLNAQAEFTKPLWTYVQDRLAPYSIAKGKAALAQNSALLSNIETRYGAPKEIVAAIWGMESGYGAFTGNIDAPSALATMAMHLDRRAFAERQLEAIISIIEQRFATRAQLKGSWSAAMGHTQFIPTTYLERAVDWNNDGVKDFWTTPDDALASTGHFLQEAGWRADQPWGLEISLGGAKALKLADSAMHPLADFAGAGVKRADGALWKETELQREGRLFLPAGRLGPAFIVFSNFDAIKEYNRSEAYALSVCLLGEALAGRRGVIAAWPSASAAIMTPDDVRKLQAGLTALGYPAGELDGKIGTQTRIALHSFQMDRNLPADGFPTPEALAQVIDAITTPNASATPALQMKPIPDPVASPSVSPKKSAAKPKKRKKTRHKKSPPKKP